ncbi:hypothetical protein N7491_006583 [Penicillium cf. griseofulvum]|nr:hypothetical protein N7491_006583 [Penicillium cf. griseofulvum]
MGHDIAKRSVVVTSKAAGVSSATIAEVVGLSKRTVDRIYERALAKGFDAALRPWNISDAMLADAPRSGRPKKQSIEYSRKYALTGMGEKKAALILLEKLAVK